MQKTQHPSNNSVLRAPQGMDAEECGALAITRVHFEDGTPAIYSYWKPTAQELALILEGASIRLGILGNGHPPVILGVAGDGYDAQ